jgi:hypothetical protein
MGTRIRRFGFRLLTVAYHHALDLPHLLCTPDTGTQVRMYSMCHRRGAPRLLWAGCFLGTTPKHKRSRRRHCCRQRWGLCDVHTATLPPSCTHRFSQAMPYRRSSAASCGAHAQELSDARCPPHACMRPAPQTIATGRAREHRSACSAHASGVTAVCGVVLVSATETESAGASLLQTMAGHRRARRASEATSRHADGGMHVTLACARCSALPPAPYAYHLRRQQCWR